MRWRPLTKFSPIGLDLGSHSIKAVQLKDLVRGREVSSSLSLARASPSVPLDANEIERLRGVFDRRGFVGRDVVVAVPPAALLSAILELPARAPGVPLEQIAAAEFARLHKHDSSSLTLSTWELPAPARASKASYMLAVGAVSAKLEEHIDLIESQNLNVVAIDEPCSASGRGCLYSSGTSPGFTAVIDMGWEAATLVILSDSTVVYTRKLGDAGLRRLNAAVQEACSSEAGDVEHELWRIVLVERPLADVENSEVFDALESHLARALVEIGQALSYTTHQYPDATISRAIVVGGGAAIPGIAKRFETGLGVPTSVAGADRSACTGGEAWASIALALGLALWGKETR